MYSNKHCGVQTPTEGVLLQKLQLFTVLLKYINSDDEDCSFSSWVIVRIDVAPSIERGNFRLF